MSSDLTIFTPTYNRSHLLPRLYESLLAQTNTCFSWLIVDDGSTDATEPLVKSWQAESDLSIRYIRVANGGKQRAHNIAVEASDAELFLCVDSDDYLPAYAVAELMAEWHSVEDSTLAGIVGLRGTDPNTPMGTWMPDGLPSSTLRSLYELHAFRGDTALLFRTAVLRRFPFEVADGENYIGESSVYFRIDRHYKMALLNRVVYIGEYQDEGYTSRARKLILENPRGYAQLNAYAYEASSTTRGKLISMLKYLVGAQLAGLSVREAPNIPLAFVMAPLACAVRLLMYR